MKENFDKYGAISKSVREFSTPSLRKNNVSIKMSDDNNHKRYRNKKQGKMTQSKKTTKQLSQL